MARETDRECLQCGRLEAGVLCVGLFCSESCRKIYDILKRLGYRVRKGL